MRYNKLSPICIPEVRSCSFGFAALCFAFSALLPASATAAPNTPDPKQPATWLVPGNGFEPVAPLPFRTLETAWHRLPDGRVLVARGDHIAVSTDGMKTFPEENNISFVKNAPAEFTAMFAGGVGRGARLVISASGAWLVVWRAPYSPSKLPEFWDKTTHDYVPGLTGGQLCLTRSTDAGKTWSTPARISDPRFTIGHPPRKVLQTKSGILLIPAQYRTPGPGRHTVSMLRSTDDGVSWAPILPTFDLPNSNGNHDGLVEPTLAQLNDGTVWLLFRTNLGTLWQSRSLDDGLTWTPLITTRIQASSSPATLERLSDNRLVLVWNPWRDSENNPPQTRGADASDYSLAVASWQRRELVLATSRDEGKTWSAPLVIARHPRITGNNSRSGWITYAALFEYQIHLYVFADSGDLQARIPVDKLP